MQYSVFTAGTSNFSISPGEMATLPLPLPLPLPSLALHSLPLILNKVPKTQGKGEEGQGPGKGTGRGTGRGFAPMVPGVIEKLQSGETDGQHHPGGGGPVSSRKRPTRAEMVSGSSSCRKCDAAGRRCTSAAGK